MLAGSAEADGRLVWRRLDPPPSGADTAESVMAVCPAQSYALGTMDVQQAQRDAPSAIGRIKGKGTQQASWDRLQFDATSAMGRNKRDGTH